MKRKYDHNPQTNVEEPYKTSSLHNDAMTRVISFIPKHSLELNFLASTCHRMQKLILLHYKSSDCYMYIKRSSYFGNMQMAKEYVSLAIECDRVREMIPSRHVGFFPHELIESLIATHHFDRNAMAKSVARFGTPKTMEMLLERKLIGVDTTLSRSAAKGNNIPMLEWLKTKKCIFTVRAYASAAKYGNLRVLEWLKSNKVPFIYTAIVNAINYKQWSCVKWLIEHESVVTGVITFVAEKKYDIIALCVERFRDRKEYFENTSEHSFIKALDNYDNDEFMCLVELAGNFLRPWALLKKPIKENNFDLLLWMHGKFGSNILDESVMRYAVLRGNFNIVKWLYSINCPVPNHIMHYAFVGCNMEIIEWLHSEKKCVVNVSSFNALISNERKNINILKWIVNKGYKF